MSTESNQPLSIARIRSLQSLIVDKDLTIKLKNLEIGDRNDTVEALEDTLNVLQETVLTLKKSRKLAIYLSFIVGIITSAIVLFTLDYINSLPLV